MRLIDRIRAKARSSIRRIVLPEGDEPRTVAAAKIIKDEGIAEPILLAKEQIEAPANKAKLDAYAAALYELRKAKGLTEEAAAKLASDPMYYGMMMVKMGDADGLVSGAVHSTGDMLRPALQIIKTAPGMKLVSSSFLMECPDRSLGEDGLLVYADCVVNPCPNAEELANIAIATAETARKLDTFKLTITPEGTRSANPNWKKGFYIIAQKAGIPILLYGLDYQRKYIECIHSIMPSGDIEKEMREIKRYFKDFKGKHPENFTIGEEDVES